MGERQHCVSRGRDVQDRNREWQQSKQAGGRGEGAPGSFWQAVLATVHLEVPRSKAQVAVRLLGRPMGIWREAGMSMPEIMRAVWLAYLLLVAQLSISPLL